MSSFFEKLKRGMGIEEKIEEKVEAKAKPKKRAKKPPQESPEIEEVPEEVSRLPAKQPKKLKIKEEPIKPPVEKMAAPEPEKVAAPEGEPRRGREEKKEEKIEVKKWFEPEGQLAIDVYQTKTDLVIQSAIAGVKSENLNLTLEGDVVTIKGVREKPLEEEGNYFYQECYWGPFSREIILPVEVDPNRAEASMKEGILTIRIPKIARERKRKITVRE